MKITRIETLRLPEHPTTIWVQIHTADGLVGLGETYHVPGAVEAVIHDYAAQFLLGQSAFDRERHWQSFFSYANFFGHAGAEMRALSALDIALWDVLGQHLGQPIYNLIGGRCRESIPIYNTCVNTPKYADQDAFLKRPGELALSLLEQGIRQMKVWPWDRFAPQLQFAQATGPAGWAAVGPPGNYLSAEDLKAGLWTVQEIRKTVGDRMQIAIEGHSRWDLNCAIRIGRALEPYDIVWMEDMILPDSAGDLARLVRETRVPQAVSERRMTRFAYRELLEREAAHIIMLDVVWTGGITEAVKIAALADTYHLSVTPHDCTGPVNVLAALHLCAAAQNVMIQETVRGFYEGYYLDILTQPLPIREGRATFDLGPGLGARLRPEVLSRPDLRRRVSDESTRGN
ncbi:MAG: mandelate racemase/muconate lactonizing enzyme family protein [Isosphaerales bacterium]